MVYMFEPSWVLICFVCLLMEGGHSKHWEFTGIPAGGKLGVEAFCWRDECGLAFGSSSLWQWGGTKWRCFPYFFGVNDLQWATRFFSGHWNIENWKAVELLTKDQGFFLVKNVKKNPQMLGRAHFGGSRPSTPAPSLQAVQSPCWSGQASSETWRPKGKKRWWTNRKQQKLFYKSYNHIVIFEHSGCMLFHRVFLGVFQWQSQPRKLLSRVLPEEDRDRQCLEALSPWPFDVALKSWECIVIRCNRVFQVGGELACSLMFLTYF